MTTTWKDCGFDAAGDLRIQRGIWSIIRSVVDFAPRYTLFRGTELHGHFPSAHEAAVHADLIEAEAAQI